MDNLNNGYQYQPTAYQYNPYQGVYQPVRYQPQSYPQNTTPAVTPAYQVPQNISNSNLIWVQGESAVKAQYVPNGGKMVFFDSEEEKIYIKSVDASGKPEMTVLYYTDQAPEGYKSTEAPPEYATKEQLNALGDQFSSISDKFNSLSQFVTKDQLNELNNHLNTLGSQIQDIENRIMSFGKPQQTNRKGNNNGKPTV